MSDRIRSGIFLQGSRMRYAEVEHARGGLHLRRLGSCDFDFGAESAMLKGDARKLETIREAVADVFSGSRSSDFTVALSSGSVISFFSPVSDRIAEDAKKKQLEADTVLMGGRDASLNVVAEPVMSDTGDGDDTVTWYHVAAVPTEVRRNVSAILSAFYGVRQHVITCMQASARVAARLESQRPTESGRSAAAVAGCFSESTEIAILDEAKWSFGSHTTSVLPSDIAYALLNTLEQSRIVPAGLLRVYVYGDNVDDANLAALKNATAAEVISLNPLDVVQNDPVDVRSSFEPGQYVLCVGAAI